MKFIPGLLFLFIISHQINAEVNCPNQNPMPGEQISIAQLESDIERLKKELAEKQKTLDAQYEINLSDCDNIKVEKPEHLEILEELKMFCKQDPDNFFVQLKTDGELAFLLKFTQGNTKVFTFATQANVTFEYKGHKLILKGKYDYTSSGDKDDGDLERIQLIQGSSEYNYEIAETNLSSFAKLAHESQLVTKSAGTVNTHSTQVTLGMKYEFVDTDTVNLSAQVGGGVLFNQYGGNLASAEDSTQPVWTAGLNYSHVLIEDRLKASGGVQFSQSLTDQHFVDIDWNAGVDARIWRGFGIGTRYEGGYDQFAEAGGNAPFNHTIMGTLSISLSGDGWKSKGQLEKERKARELLNIN